MIAIVDYGVNNLASVQNAFRARGTDVEVTSDAATINGADGVVLPGIGAAAASMAALRERGLIESVRSAAESGRPFFAICLGMQLLFERSEEGDAACLGILPGSVTRLRTSLKVPQIGWNRVSTRTATGMWEGLGHDPYVYFVHSYVCVPADPSLISGETEYGETFCSAVARGSLWATQFHPERSGARGLRIIENFIRACRAANLSTA